MPKLTHTSYKTILMQTPQIEYILTGLFILFLVCLAILIIPIITRLVKPKLKDNREQWEKELDEAYTHLKQAEMLVYKSNYEHNQGASKDIIQCIIIIEEIKEAREISKRERAKRKQPIIHMGNIINPN